MYKLTDTQLLLLSQASQREDHYLTLPASLKEGTATTVADKLLKLKLVQEIPAPAGAPVWKADDRQPVALIVTQKGLEAIGIAEPAQEDAADRPEVPTAVTAPASPATGSKQATVLAMLGRADGASMMELTAATGWLAHTIRAALTGLRKKGHAISRASRTDGTTAYHILPPAPQAGVGG